MINPVNILQLHKGDNMKIHELKNEIEGLFDTLDNPAFESESGITMSTDKEIKKVGYCVNLTLETIKEAVKNNIDVLVTHHDAWDFVFGLKDACMKELKKNNIGHYFIHLPLDDSNFGTNETLAIKLGADHIERSHPYEGFDCGRVCTFNEPVALEELAKRMEGILEEPVRSWKYGKDFVTKIGIVCGGGEGTSLAKTAYENGCEVYITGEKILYTIQYAQFMKKNLIIGTHTFIEMPGVEQMAIKLGEKLPSIEFIKITEDHIEI